MAASNGMLVHTLLTSLMECESGRSASPPLLCAVDPIVTYDESVLGEVRGYQGLALEGGLGSLERASGDWQAAEALAENADLVLDHPEQGPIGLSEVRRIVAHDVEHHAFDLSLILNR